MRCKRKFLLFFLAVCLGALAVCLGARERKEAPAGPRGRAEEYRLLALSEKDWILRCQTAEGLYLNRPWSDGEESQQVTPYFSTIAALGMLAGTTTEAQAESVQLYIHWYLDHLNTLASDPVNGAGTIYDVTVTRTEEGLRYESTGDYDSVDSYAALFLILADRYAEKYGEDLLSRKKEAVISVAKALLRTLGENGLSYTKAEYPVQYLMDNAECYAGLLAGSRLLGKIAPETQLEEILLASAQRLGEGIETLLWDEETKTYHIGLQADVVLPAEKVWKDFYPDSIAQLFPFLFSVSEGEKHRVLYDSLCKRWRWEALEHLTKGDAHFYWCILSYAAARMGDEGRLLQFSGACRAASLQKERSYPFYIAEAGWLSMAYGLMEGCCQASPNS